MSKKLDISVLQQAAKKNGGLLLSQTYENSKTKYFWKCNKGHEWQAIAYPIINGIAWCAQCSGIAAYNENQVKSLGLQKGFELIPELAKYKNNKTKLWWLCKNNHKFTSRLNDIVSGYGCPECSRVKVPDISKLQAHAESLGGKLISTKYINCDTKYEWSCSKNHTWTATWHMISGGNWCPYCKKCKTEFECKQIIEQLTGKQFNKCRIIPFNNSKLELDGYNEELKIAFEYNGIQHYTLCNWLHKTKKEFEYQKEKDTFKKIWCKENNIKLISIPYIERSNLRQYIEKELKQ